MKSHFMSKIPKAFPLRQRFVVSTLLKRLARCRVCTYRGKIVMFPSMKLTPIHAKSCSV